MGATYTRISSAGIVDGGVIEASDFNAEFDQLVAAFVAASGHTHDGTAAEGGPVTKLLGTAITIGDATSGTDIAVTFDGESADGVLTWMEDEDYFKFSDDILMNSTEKLQFQDTGTYIYSNADGDLDVVSDGTAVDSINLESAGGITLDAGTAGSGVVYEDDGTEMLRVYNSSSDVQIESKVSDKDIVFKGNDGGSGVTSLTLDMSDAGRVVTAGNATVTGDLTITGDDLYMNTNTSGAILVADGTNYNPAVVSGDISIGTTGVAAIGSGVILNADVNASAAIADSKLATISTAGKVDIGALEIDGATEMGAGIVDADLFIIDDGAGGTEKSCLASRIKTYIGAPALTGSTNNTIVTVTGAAAVQGEANFTYDSTDAALTSSTSNKPVFSFTNTNTDANGSIIKFIKDAGEAGAANDISGLISFYADDADQNNQEFGRITGRVVDATSGGEEGALDFYVAEYDGTVTKGMEIKGLASDGNITVDISTHDGAAGGLMLASTLVTSTATELNRLDGIGSAAVGLTDTQTLTNKTLTAPKFADTGYIADASGNELIILQTTGSAVNQFDVHNAASGSNPIIEATGGDSNVGLDFTTKGTGAIKFNDMAYVPQQALTSSSNAVAWDAQAASNAYHVTTENTTFSAPSNGVEGAFICLEINYSAGHTIGWNTVFEFAASTEPTETAADTKTDLHVFRYNGAIWQEVGRTLNLSES